MAFWKRILGDENTAALKRAESIVVPTNTLEDDYNLERHLMS